ncbi:MAG: hypothetical protein D6693_03310 [Planctomycetota bacterium]|nr:MAG: hypothetical protein D6693_03310 [Planctomycetota bacterium]
MPRRSCALAILLCLAAPASIRGLEPAHKPAAARRLVRVFDFEEQGVNPDPVPMLWVRGQDTPDRPRPGFPSWNRARFDSAYARSGRTSVLLPARGGSAALTLVSGVIPVIPGGVYEVSAWVRAEGAGRAAAGLRAALTTDTHRPIPGAEAAADPVVGATEGWRRIAVRVRAGPEAAWLTIDLELRQPGQRPDADRLTPDDRLDDLTARAWFDDVTVRLAPVLSLDAGGETGVILGADPPTLRASVEDVAGDPLVARLTVLDADGRPVSERVIDPVRPGVATDWRPALPAYGWHSARLTVYADGDAIGETTRPFIWAPDEDAPPAGAFGVALADGASAPTVTQSLIAATGAGAVDLPLWAGVETEDDLAASIGALTSMLESLLSAGVDAGVWLDALPAGLARSARLEPGRVVEALAHADRSWEPWLDEALSRFGQRVGRWRLGPMTRAPGHNSAVDAERFETAAGAIRERVLNPAVSLTLPMTFTPDAPIDAGAVAWVWPAPMAPRAVVDLTAADPALAESDYLIEADPSIPPRARAIDLARRAVRAMQAGARRVTLVQPWSWRRGDPVASGEPAATVRADPDIALAAWRTLTRQLGGRRVVGALPMHAGAVALVLDGEQGGAIVAWNEWAEPADAVLSGYLAPGAIRVVDLFGNESVAPLRDGVHSIRLTQAPIFIEGVDVELARFRAGFRVTPEHIESTAARHDLTLSLTNPWPVAVTGALRVVGPEGWSFTPRERRFTLSPGAEARLPVSASFGLSAQAGPDRLRAEVRLVAGEAYPVLTLEAPIELGLTGVELIPSYEVRRRDGRADLVVTLLVINTGHEPATLTAFAQAPGFKRRQAPVSDLAPLSAVVRRFVFRDGGQALAGRSVQVGVIQSVGLGRLTTRLDID